MEQQRAIAAVITVSDRSARGERADASGPRAAELLQRAGYPASVVVVPDGADNVGAAIGEALNDGARIVITTGGTGVAPRDETPEGTLPHIVRELPGIAEELRRRGAESVPTAVLSRGLAGVARGSAGEALVVNLPGSTAAVEQGIAVIAPLVGHILQQLEGGDHA
ncbi:MogA/MoaB family molybdenum cofactor biosynthesis protein [Rathayibacter sp. YIM 133350]|uniref:MogA/MoaB family molybdenum cofactor biosynthesis protein n=1 Tax=Rathayibacter sp. YIM 133350 TaxID=3131992 RepID=UPI00307ED801